MNKVITNFQVFKSLENIKINKRDLIIVSTTIHFKMTNILDAHYRQFASAISAPGRSFMLGFKTRFLYRIDFSIMTKSSHSSFKNPILC